MSKKKPVLVTGGKGFIGFNLCKKLLANGESVVVVDNGASGDNIIEHDNIQYYNIDINDIEYSGELMTKQYKIIKKVFSININKFLVLKILIPVKKNVIGIKNETNPIDWKKRSET